MNISILVFGNEEFLATLPSQVKDTDAFSLEAINNLGMAVSLIQQEPPDIILVQSSQNESMQFCSWLKEQTKLSWIYCILLEDSLELIAERRHQSWEWESEMTSRALRLGADAYIWYGNTQDSESVRQRRTDSNETQLNPSHRLLLSQLNVALRKAHKYRDLMQTNDLLSTIALADSLTELNNRRALQWDLPRQIKNAREDNSPLSLIILDVDYFKKVNDNYGHLVGDKLLKLLSSRIRHNLRIQDTAFRYGGEEFVVILSDTTLEEAAKVAHRLNSLIRENPFVIDDNLSINVTISLGASCLLPDDDDQGISLLNRADAFLLQAKSNGRNRVVSCGKNIGDSHIAASSQKKCLNEVNYSNFGNSTTLQSFPIKLAG
ncbi:MAG: GGDEF domain-containing protein [Cyanobacteria bacterium J06633_8]